MDPGSPPTQNAGTRTASCPAVSRFVAVLLSTVVSVVPFQSEAEGLSVRNSVQTGIEYDSNVFKAFGGSQGGYLSRTLLKSNGTYFASPAFRLGWGYQGGGKIFFDQASKDALIQFVEAPLAWQASPSLEILFRPDFKYQEEKGTSDPTSAYLSEDYYSTTSRLDARISLPSSVLLLPYGEFTFFHFAPEQRYSFLRESGGLTVQKTVGSLVAFGAQYVYGRQQFDADDREDREQQASAFLQYLRVPFVSTRYTFEWTSSSLPQYSFQNHRITVVLSVPILPRAGADSASDEHPGMPPALFAFHLLGTLQLKNYPSVYDYTQEGQRYLLTGAEDDIFNYVVAKLSYHPFPRWAFEAKYTQYWNNSSGEENSFSRALVYGGARFSF